MFIVISKNLTSRLHTPFKLITITMGFAISSIWMKMIDSFILDHNRNHKFIASHVCAQLTR